MTDTLSYYSQPGPMTDPGACSSLLDNLPADISSLVRIVQGLTVHVFWAKAYGLELTPERRGEVTLRSLERRLARTLELDDRPLLEPRPAEKRLVGNCRDFSLLFVSLLRYQGIPARARCGFGAYFMPNHFEDHWVGEYWNTGERRWILVDAQLDELQCKALKIPFDPLDVPRDQFIVGGRAWQMCRSEGYDAETFGIFDMHGLGFVRGDFVRDVASLNKVELLPWDCWGIIENPSIDDPADLAFLDKLADFTCGDVPDLETVRSLYQSDPRLRVEGSIHSYEDSGMKTVEIPA